MDTISPNDSAKPEWLRKAIATHNSKYDYSRVEYVNRHAKCEIICPVHGSFRQDMHSHLRGAGCPDCAGLRRWTTEMFIERAKSRHGDKYSYSKSVVTGATKKVTITCPAHGDFEQTARDHVARTDGCPQCGVERSAAKRIEKSRVKYSSTLPLADGGVFTGVRNKVRLICSRHGEYESRAADVLYKETQCPRCAVQVSRWEAEVGAFVEALGLSHMRTRDVIGPKEIDIWVPERRVGIECHGVRFHSSAFQEGHTAHLDKLRAADRAGVRLLQIFEDEWKYRRGAVENVIASALGRAARISARKCTVVVETPAEVKDFLDAYHIQGSVRGRVAYSLFVDGARIATMVFGAAASERGTTGGTELLRYCSVGTVIGGASKLFSAFISGNPDVRRVVSYSDRRLFTGAMYQVLKFKKVRDTRPGYTVLVGDRRMHKANFKRAMLAKRLGPAFDSSKSEREMCEAHGWFRVYDCGLTKWEWLIG